VKQDHTFYVIRPTLPGGRLSTSEPTKGVVMGREARIGLLLGASACLLAVMVDWVIEELNK